MARSPDLPSSGCPQGIFSGAGPGPDQGHPQRDQRRVRCVDILSHMHAHMLHAMQDTQTRRSARRQAHLPPHAPLSLSHAHACSPTPHPLELMLYGVWTSSLSHTHAHLPPLPCPLPALTHTRAYSPPPPPEHMLCGLTMTRSEYDAHVLRNAMKGVGTDEVSGGFSLASCMLLACSLHAPPAPQPCSTSTSLPSPRPLPLYV